MTNTTKSLMIFAALSSQLALASQPTVPTTADSRIQADSPSAADGSTGNPRRTVLSLQPIPMVAGMGLSLLSPGTTVLVLPVELEQAMTPNVSVSLSLVPMYLETPTQAAGGLGMNAGVRAYPFGRAPDGFWFGAKAGATLLMSESSGAAGFDLQPLIGYQWVHQSGLTVSLGVGLSLGALASGQLPLTVQVPVGFAW